MKRFILLTTLFAALAPGALKKPVRVESGLIQGMEAPKAPAVTAFLGVPFAAPPVAARRWKAPEAPVKWNGVRVADHVGAACIQNIVEEKKPWTHEFMAHEEVSEDCLFLNIWTAASAPSDKRPVLVYLHGGANTEGSGAIDSYNGEAFARKGLVAVTINYRLGIFGFFTHPELSKESGHGSGNYALLDQLAALQWVKKDIAAFGGDPERVTVAGQSAGAFDIACLLASPLAKGLFQRAIMESGGVSGGGGVRPLETSEQDGVKFADAKNAKSLKDLRALPWKEVFANAPRFGPVTDGYVIAGSAKEIFGAGPKNDVPTLTGSNADENGASPAGTPAANDAARDRARTALIQWAAARAENSKSNAYLYFWNHVLPGPDSGKYGAFHTSEVPYVFDSLSHSDRPFTDEDRRIAAETSGYWANFAATGDPNGKGLPHWPSYREQPAVVMQLGDNSKPIPAAAAH